LSGFIFCIIASDFACEGVAFLAFKVLEATDVTTFAIIDDNGDGFFTISNAGQIQVAKVGLDLESEKSHTRRYYEIGWQWQWFAL
jgi:hypothetical protein